MPGDDRKIDPITHDYVDDDAGGFATTRTLETALQHQVLGERGQWAGDAEAGSDLYLFSRARDSERELARIAEAVRASLKPFVEAGLAASPAVQVDRDQRGRWVISSSIRDLQYGTVSLTTIASKGA